jgi:hypothetical protein
MRKESLLIITMLIFAVPVICHAQAEESSEVSLKAEAELCTGIEERMPVGTAESFAPEVDKVYLWCKILGAEEPTSVRHVWYYDGEEMAMVELAVESESWRTWSYKTILPEWTGNWEVKVLDANDKVLKTMAFKIGEMDTEPQAEPQEEPQAEPKTEEETG